MSRPTAEVCINDPRKRLLLVQPVPVDENMVSQSSFGTQLYPLGLLTLDAMTPKKEWAVDIVDEGQGRLDLPRVDTKNLALVGIGCWTHQAPRAYEMAAHFREQGIPVIIGGPHPSALPEEALKFADSVCIGEAESVWPQILADALGPGLQEIYRGEKGDLKQVPVISNPFRNTYFCGSVQARRGCPWGCDFCSITENYGARVRYRPLDDVLKEWRGITQRVVLFADDNIIGGGDRGRQYTLDFCQELVKLRDRGIRNRYKYLKYWGTQATQNLGEDNELLDWLYRAGCRMVLYGFESIAEQSLQERRKRSNLGRVADYAKNIRNTQRRGIAVIGSFVFGSDADPDDIFDATVLFTRESGLAAKNFNLLTPLPGTKLYPQCAQSGRLRYTNYPGDWVKYGYKDPTIKPEKGSPLELLKKRIRAEEELNGRVALIRQALSTLWQTKSPVAAAFSFAWNSGGRGFIRQHDYQPQLAALAAELELEAQQQVQAPSQEAIIV